MKAVILCAGYATRLYPLTLNTPKPLLPIKGTPILEIILKQLKSLAKKEILNEIILITNDKFYDTFVEWKETYKAFTKVTIVNDQTTSNETRLGAVGDILYAVNNQNIDEDIFISAADNLFKTDMQEMYDISQEKDSSVIATYNFKDPALLANKFGVVEVDKNGRITGFEEKPGKPKSSITATAIYLIKKDDIQGIKEYISKNKQLDNMGEMIIFLTNNSKVYTRPIDNWIDIGSLEDYEEANKN